MQQLRAKFIEYFTNGIPVYIDDKEKHDFYENLNNFINDADNEYESLYVKYDDHLSVCDKFVSYLTVSYENSKIKFRTTNETSTPVAFMSNDTKVKLAEILLGVIMFVEKHAPSDDLSTIPRRYRDRWKI